MPDEETPDEEDDTERDMDDEATTDASPEETTAAFEFEATVEELHEEIDTIQERIDERTVHRDDIESDLKRYVRQRVRRGHAQDWGPYLVLLYGTAMTFGAFYYLSGLWAILAMLVIWLSTLGLYVFMLVVGFGLSLLGLPGRLRDRISAFRS